MSRAWYVLSVISGHENKVVEYIKKEVSQRENLSRVILDTKIPTENVEIRTKENIKIIKKKRIYPGYVLIEMDLPSDKQKIKEILSIITRIPNVRGVLGTKSLDVPPKSLSLEDVKTIFEKTGELKGKSILDLSSSFEVGDSVRINDGPFKGLVGKVVEVYPDKFRLKIHIEIFNRETPININFDQVSKL